MNPPEPERLDGFFRPTPLRTVTRALPPAVLWSYAAGAAGGLLVGVLAALTLVVAWVMSWFGDTAVGETVGQAVNLGLWVLGPVVLAAAVGAAAYGATESRSFPRTVAGTVGALGVAASLLALDMAWFAFAALVFGWAVAIPADRAGRVALRALVPLVGAIVLASTSFGTIGDLSVAVFVLVLAVSPPAAAVWIWVADALVLAIGGRRSLPADP